MTTFVFNMAVKFGSQKNAKKMKSSAKFDRDYYALGNPIYMSIIAFGIWFMLMATFVPDNFPAFLGPLGTFGTYMGHHQRFLCKLSCFFCLACHLYEANIARNKCKKLNLSETASKKWIISTFLFGFPFLQKLEQFSQRK